MPSMNSKQMCFNHLRDDHNFSYIIKLKKKKKKKKSTASFAPTTWKAKLLRINNKKIGMTCNKVCNSDPLLLTLDKT